MKKESNKSIMLSCNFAIDTLFSVETIIKLMLEYCLAREIKSIHYDLSSKDKKILSEERNHYITMLNIALEKLQELKELNQELEDKITVL